MVDKLVTGRTFRTFHVFQCDRFSLRPLDPWLHGPSYFQILATRCEKPRTVTFFLSAKLC